MDSEFVIWVGAKEYRDSGYCSLYWMGSADTMLSVSRLTVMTLPTTLIMWRCNNSAKNVSTTLPSPLAGKGRGWGKLTAFHVRCEEGQLS